MKNLLLLLLLAALHVGGWAQTPSDCTVPTALREAYRRDVMGMAVKRMEALGSPDFNQIEIPESWQDSILEGMAAILNAPDMPAADSVFNLYCVHEGAFNPVVYGVIIGVDTGSPIAEAWAAGQTLTGNAFLDSLLTRYQFTLTNYISFGAAVLYTPKLLNLYALGNVLAANVPGIQYGEPDGIIGGAGRIEYRTDDGARLYDFRYEWNDCFDGCDNYYQWSFRVGPDCSVTYLGSETDGFFGVEPLPAPTNCMLTAVDDSPVEAGLGVVAFPNPTQGLLRLAMPKPLTAWQLSDAAGQILRTGTNPEIDMTTLPAATYWLRCTGADGRMQVLKVLKI